MTADIQTSVRASRRRVARSRGALSGILLMILGLWAALVPFIGPYLNIAYTPRPNDAWNWTAARGWLEVLPGVAVFLGGLLLLVSSSRAMTVFGGWLAALGGAWLIVGEPLSDALNLNAGRPDPSMGTNTRAGIALVFFYATGAVILFVASVALGRVSVLSVRDIRAAERRAEAEEAQQQAALEAAAAREEAAREEADREAAGRHAEHAGVAENVRPAGEREGRLAEPGRNPQVPQYAGGPQHPYGPNGGAAPGGPAGQPGAAGQSGAAGQPGQAYPPQAAPTQPPTQQYPSAPPPRE